MDVKPGEPNSADLGAGRFPGDLLSEATSQIEAVSLFWSHIE